MSPGVYAIILKLSPEFTEQLRHPGVFDAVTSAAAAGRTPTAAELVALGQSEVFAEASSEHLAYLVRLREASVLRAAGPFEGLSEGMYLCTSMATPLLVACLKRTHSTRSVHPAGVLHGPLARRYLSTLAICGR